MSVQRCCSCFIVGTHNAHANLLKILGILSHQPLSTSHFYPTNNASSIIPFLLYPITPVKQHPHPNKTHISNHFALSFFCRVLETFFTHREHPFCSMPPELKRQKQLLWILLGEGDSPPRTVRCGEGQNTSPEAHFCVLRARDKTNASIAPSLNDALWLIRSRSSLGDRCTVGFGVSGVRLARSHFHGSL